MTMSNGDPDEVFTTAEVAAKLKAHPETVRRIFSDEPGVIKLVAPNKNGKPRRVTLRIPRYVFERVRRRMGGENADE